MYLNAIFSVFLLLSYSLFGNEIFDSSQEQLFLKNIKQVTFPSMGFEKAGEAYFSPDGKTIAFQAVPEGKQHYQIYVMNLEEGLPRMISTGRGACTCAYFHPDGNKIIFASSHEDPALDCSGEQKETQGYKRKGSKYQWEFTPFMNIYEANLDGSNLKALTSGIDYHAECAYSSDGSRIVYVCNKDKVPNIFIMNADGTDERQVTFTDYCYNGGPFFSPDGSRIIFRADRQTKHYLQIYVVDADGANEHQLTNNGAVNWAPYWHPNGKVIVFATSLHGHSHYEIYAMNIDTGISTRLTHNSSFDGLPTFNMAGSRMMWTSKRGADNTCQIFLADFCMPEELQ